MTRSFPLDPNVILSREFEYAQQTALQANEDRIKIYTYFMGTLASLAATIIFPDLEKSLDLFIFANLFAMLAVLGSFSFLKLLKLRLAWNSSIIAMNKIKQFYVAENENLKNAFYWTERSIPGPGKTFTIAYMMGLTVALCASLCFGISILLGLYLLVGKYYYLVMAIVVCVIFLLHIVIWSIGSHSHSR